MQDIKQQSKWEQSVLFKPESNKTGHCWFQEDLVSWKIWQLETFYYRILEKEPAIHAIVAAGEATTR
jgi:hypothetical protein